MSAPVHPIRRVREERGGVAIFVALMMSVVLGATAMVVDLGMQRIVRTDMQALADVVSLDLSRHLDGSTAAVLGTQLPVWTKQSRDRNLTNVGDPPVVTSQLGTISSAGVFTQVSGTAVPTAVRVTAQSKVAFSLGGVTGVSSGSASRSAVSTVNDPGLCFSVGTKALTLDTNQSALSPLLTNILKVNLAAVGYEGLVNLKNVAIPVADLLIKLNVGSLSQVATTSVSLNTFIVAAADVLTARGDTAQAAILKSIKLGVAGGPIALGKILAVTTGGSVAGLTADLNVLDILGASIVAANGRNAVAVNLTGVGGVTIIEPPQIACGRAGVSARSAQVRLRLNPTILANASLGLVGGSTDVQIELAAGTATLGALDCAAQTAPITVVSSGARVLAPSELIPPSTQFGQAQLKVTMSKFLEPLGFLGAVLIAALRLIGGDVSLDVLLSGSVASSTETRTVTFPAAPALPPAIVVPTGGVGKVLTITGAGVQLSANQGSILSLLTPVLNAVLAAVLTGVVQPLVNTVVSPLLTGVLSPLLTTLGVKLGVTEVNVLGRLQCSTPRLVK